MCTRYIPPNQAAIEAYWRLKPGDALRWPAEVFPRLAGPFLRVAAPAAAPELVLGQWGLIPWFAKTPVLKFATNNARFEGIEDKASYKHPWQRSQRCVIPALTFDEPCWETGKNVWWRFRRADGAPWGLAGLWNVWRDPASGENLESYTMLTINADDHPIMKRMHKPEPKLAANQQDKRSVVAIEPEHFEQWLHGTRDEAAALIVPPEAELMLAGPVGGGGS